MREVDGHTLIGLVVCYIGNYVKLLLGVQPSHDVLVDRVRRKGNFQHTSMARGYTGSEY